MPPFARRRLSVRFTGQPIRRPNCRTLCTYPRDLKPVRKRLEFVPLGQRRTQTQNLCGIEFNDPAATQADHVVVGFLAERMLVAREGFPELHLVDDPARDEQW